MHCKAFEPVLWLFLGSELLRSNALVLTQIEGSLPNWHSLVSHGETQADLYFAF